MIPEPIMLRCIANCLETSRYYASKGNRPLADWWHDRAKVFAPQPNDRILAPSRPRKRSQFGPTSGIEETSRSELTTTDKTPE
jgi:hypothetical protein